MEVRRKDGKSGERMGMDLGVYKGRIRGKVSFLFGWFVLKFWLLAFIFILLFEV